LAEDDQSWYDEESYRSGATDSWLLAEHGIFWQKE
jgi:hypothetical protein